MSHFHKYKYKYIYINKYISKYILYIFKYFEDKLNSFQS